jgi:hypothetical protein
MMHIRRSRLGTLSVAAATLLTTACHTYTPIAGQDVTPGGTVRVRLTDNGAVSVAPSVGPYARSMEGRVSSISDSAMVLSVTELTRANGQEETWRGESVTVPRSGVADMAVPKLSSTRSWLLAGGLVAGAAALGAVLGGAGQNVGKGGGSSTGGAK